VLALPLYPASPAPVVLDGQTLAPDKGCKRCRLSSGARSPCLAAEGDPSVKGGVLFVAEAPSREDDLRSRPFTGKVGSYVRPLIEKIIPSTPVVFDYAVKCSPGLASTDKALVECRPYLRETIRQAAPSRIVAFGSKAIRALTGRSVWPVGTRGGHTWTVVDNVPTPIFYVVDPIEALQNRYIRQVFEEDLRWALTAPVTPPTAWREDARVVQTIEDAEEAAQDLLSSPWFAYDCEWAGHQYNRSFRLLSVACVPCDVEYAWVWDLPALQNPALVAPLRRALESKTTGKTGHYLQTDIQAVKLGIGATVPDAGVRIDTLYLLNLLDPEADGGLEWAAELVGMGGHKAENEAAVQAEIDRFRKWVKRKHDNSVRTQNARAQVSLFAAVVTDEDPLKLWPSMTPELIAEMEAAVLAEATADDLKTWAFGLVDRAVLSRYNALDTIATARLARLLQTRLDAGPWELRATWRENVRPAIWAIAQVEAWGVGADRDNIRLMRTWLEGKRAAILEKFRPYGWHEDPKVSKFNLESNDQMAEFLYETLRDSKGKKLRCTMETESGARSTGAEALEDLEDLHPMIKEVQDYRTIKVQLSKDLLGFVRDDGRFHSRFNLNGSRTSRLTSVDPNLHNQKRAEDDIGKFVRSCVVAEDGFTLVGMDQAQVELRIGGGLAGDKVMIDTFVQGQDIHMTSARLVSKIRWGIPPEQVTDAHRQEHKPTTLAVFYDDEPYGLAFKLNITVDEAKNLIFGIFGAFKRVPKWIGEQVALGTRDGGVWSWWNGRRCRFRPLRNLGSPDKKKFKTARRGCWNTPTQTTANEFMLMALVKMVNWVHAEGLQNDVRVVLTIHDELTFEIRDQYIPLVIGMAYRILRSFRTPGGVPLDVDCKMGKIWGSMQKTKFVKVKALLPFDEPESYPEAT